MRVLVFIPLLATITIAQAQTAASPPATAPTTTPAATRPAFTLGKDTTRITSPLLPDGRPDYLTYMDQTLSKGVTPENNALVALLEVLGTDANMIPPKIHDEALKRLGVKEDHAATYQSFPQYLKKQGIPYDSAKDQEEMLALKHPWSADDHPDVARWLDENNAALDRIVKATTRERYYWPLIPTTHRARVISILLPGLGRTREAANGLASRAMLRFDKGQVKEAQADLLALHRLSRLLSQGPTLIEQLVGIALETLAARGDVELAASLKPDLARAYLDQLAKLPPLGETAAAVDQRERFSALDAVLCVATYGLDEIGDLHTLANFLEIPEIDNPTFKGHWNTDHVDWDLVLKQMNAWFDRTVETMRKPTFAERKAAVDALEKDFSTFKTSIANAKNPTDRMANLLRAFLIPSLGRARELADKAQEHSDLATLALALSAFHGDKNAYPDQLSDLAPAYLKTIPQDIYANAPLIYRKQDQGYLLYSIGPNLKDDQGTPGRDDNTGDFIVKMPK